MLAYSKHTQHALATGYRGMHPGKFLKIVPLRLNVETVLTENHKPVKLMGG